MDSYLKRLPLLRSHHTMNLMAKAAVTVYEAAFENCALGRQSGETAN